MYERFRELVDRLLEKTEQGDLNWIEGSSRSAFQVHFPRYSVEIEDEESDFILRMFDQKGSLLETVVAADLDSGSPYYDKYKEKLRTLHQLARRHALNVDAALDDLLSDLAL